MKWLESRSVWGGFLILAGLLFLLQNLGFFPVGDLFWLAVRLLAGVFIVALFLQNRQHWWALIPGFTLLSSAAADILAIPGLGLDPDWSSTVMLGGIAASFLVIYLLSPQRWWALIPFGVLVTLAVVARLQVAEYISGGAFFFGLGLTFLLVALAPTPQGRLQWAWVPAGLLILVGILFFISMENLVNYIWPAFLILGGGYVLWRAFSSRG